MRTARQPAHPLSCGSCSAQASMLASTNPRQFGLSRASGDVCSTRLGGCSARRETFAALVPTAATSTISTPMIVDGSPPVRRRAAAGVASTCLFPSTELRTRARSDSLAIFVATFLPDTCSCFAVERPPGPFLGFRCHALARSRSRLATLKASPPCRPYTPCLSGRWNGSS